MPISSDMLNGYPTKTDPNPVGRGGKIFGHNGYPQEKKKPRPDAPPESTDTTPAEQRRLVETAVRNTEKQIRKRRIVQFLEIYEVPPPQAIPGQKGLYSRWLKDQGDSKHRFPDIEAMCKHLVENYSDDEKDAKWHAFMEETQPEVEAAEAEAQQMYERIQAAEVDNDRTPPKILSTSELPVGEGFTPTSTVPDPH